MIKIFIKNTVIIAAENSNIISMEDEIATLNNVIENFQLIYKLLINKNKIAENLKEIKNILFSIVIAQKKIQSIEKNNKKFENNNLNQNSLSLNINIIKSKFKQLYCLKNHEHLIFLLFLIINEQNTLKKKEIL